MMKLLEDLVKAWNGTKVVVGLKKESYEKVQHFLSEENQSLKRGILDALQMYEFIAQRQGAMNIIYEKVNPPYEREIIHVSDFDTRLFVLEKGDDHIIPITFKKNYERLLKLTTDKVTPEDVVRQALGAYITIVEKYKEGYWVEGRWTDNCITTIGQGKVGEGKEFLLCSQDDPEE